MFRRKTKEENWFKKQEGRLLNELEIWEIGSQQYADALEQYILLVKGKIEIEKEREETFFKEMDLLIKLLSVGGGLVSSWVFMNKGFKFEETGVLTSGTFQRFLNNYNKRKDFG